MTAEARESPGNNENPSHSATRPVDRHAQGKHPTAWTKPSIHGTRDLLVFEQSLIDTWVPSLPPTLAQLSETLTRVPLRVTCMKSAEEPPKAAWMQQPLQGARKPTFITAFRLDEATVLWSGLGSP